MPKLNNINTDNYNSNKANSQNKKNKNGQVYFPSLTQDNRKKDSNKKQDYTFSFMYSIKFENLNKENKKFVKFMNNDKIF